MLVKRLLVILVGILLASCSHVQWVKTTDGKYIYGKLPKNKDVVWNGGSIGPLVSGKGTISILGKDGVVKKSTDDATNLGAMSGYNYVPISNGMYLGKKKNDLPNGFGALVRNDTLYFGKFKKGKLNTGNVFIYHIEGKQGVPVFEGMYKNGQANGVGTVYRNGVLSYEGGLKKGNHHGLGKEYDGGELSFEGSYKNGARSGAGKEYSNGVLIYNGEWSHNVRNGQGTVYNERGLMVYSGDWKNGVYNGKGKLYENGQCIEGKWDDGRLTKSISTSVFNEIGSATKMWLSNPDSLDLSSGGIVEEGTVLPASTMEFIEQLNGEIEEHLTKNFERRVDKRFGFWNLPRMIGQPWFKSDIKRANAAQKYFCKKVEAKEMENLINAKIDYYNQNTSDSKLQYVKLDKIPDGAIVDTETAIKVFEREAMETTDILVGIVVDILICFVIAFIIGFIIGAFIPTLLPYVGLVDLIMAILAFLVGLYLSIFRTTTVSIDLENMIVQMLTDNYMQFLDTQNVILQILGVL